MRCQQLHPIDLSLLPAPIELDFRAFPAELELRPAGYRDHPPAQVAPTQRIELMPCRCDPLPRLSAGCLQPFLRGSQVSLALGEAASHVPGCREAASAKSPGLRELCNGPLKSQPWLDGQPPIYPCSWPRSRALGASLKSCGHGRPTCLTPSAVWRGSGECSESQAGRSPLGLHPPPAGFEELMPALRSKPPNYPLPGF